MYFDGVVVFVMKFLSLFRMAPAILSYHSMASANLNKTENLVTNTTTASKYIPERPRIWINLNPPFQTKIYVIKVLFYYSIII
jgi:hypothetical protein